MWTPRGPLMESWQKTRASSREGRPANWRVESASAPFFLSPGLSFRVPHRTPLRSSVEETRRRTSPGGDATDHYAATRRRISDDRRLIPLPTRTVVCFRGATAIGGAIDWTRKYVIFDRHENLAAWLIGCASMIISGWLYLFATRGCHQEFWGNSTVIVISCLKYCGIFSTVNKLSTHRFI